jgi:TIR domain-containing protein
MFDGLWRDRNTMAKIFISHSSINKDFARKLASDLRGLGHVPWLDEYEIRVGDCIVTKIEHGIADADYVAVILSKHSVQSGWVEREWKSKYWTEVEQDSISVLPVLVEDCDIPNILKTKLYPSVST